MNAEAKKKWVEALRSGKYRQVHGTLFSGVNDGTVMCCALGVLNDVSGLGEWRTEFYVVEDYEDTDLEYIDEEAWQEVVAFSREGHKLRQFMERGGEVRLPLAAELEEDEEVRAEWARCIGGEEEYLHAAVAKWAGLPEQDPKLLVDGLPRTVVDLNDGARNRGGPKSWWTFEELADLIEAQL